MKNLKPFIIIFFLSLSTLSFEIILARIFSYILAYHFVFIIIAFSILAIALGQLYTSRLIANNSFSISKYFILLQALFPISLAAIFILPAIENIGSGSTGLLMYIFLSGITFFLVGVITAYIFQNIEEKISRLYAVDLLGAAAGSLLGLFLLNEFAIFQALAFISIIFSGAAFFAVSYDKKNKAKLIILSSLAAISAMFFIFIPHSPQLTIAKSPNKDLLRIQSDPSVKSDIVDSEWNSFGKTDLVEFYYTNSTSSQSMFIDGAAGTRVVSIAELEKDSVRLSHTLMHSGIYFPFNFLNENEKDTALIIGPGGGYDIAIAYFGGVKKIGAVEVNPSFVSVMKKYNPSTFTDQPNIDVIISEGRNFVKTSNTKYDLIFLTIPITKGVRSSDFVNLTENYLFTMEAVEDYLNILTPEGRIIFTMHNSEEVYKMLSNYLELQSKRGLTNREAFKYIYVVDNGMNPLLVIKKNAFNKEDIEPRHYLSHKLRFDNGITFFPFTQQLRKDTVLQGQNYEFSMFDDILYKIANNKYNFHDVTEKALVNLHPVSDDSPFFFNYNLGIPDNMDGLIYSVVILIGLFAFLFKRNFNVRFDQPNKSENYSNLFRYFSFTAFVLGFSYILVQSYLFQMLNTFLSNPLESFSVLLFSFLLGTAGGSYAVNTIKRQYLLLGVYSIIAALTVLLIEIFVIIPSYNSPSTLELFLLVVIPAVLIGIPFPVLLQEVFKIRTSNGIPIILGISGGAGFIGSVGVLIVATLWSYKVVLTLAGVGYILVIYIYNKVSKQQVYLNYSD